MLSFPGDDEHITQQLVDYGAVFNAKVFDVFNMNELKDLEQSDLGNCLKVEIMTSETFFIGVPEKNSDHEKRIAERVSVV